ncbi:MAG: glucose-1-phosphate adenylyltransferase subunit GlgD [Oscillospiraceae bacterium]|jgi:glucose-1-phosphate adenylyltransferase|nr:glucose-1-phosphate adenylyltransferase subunit GlgD [Oscillospiraceae bacterium]
MRTNNVLGILFSNSNDETLPELTRLRTMGSVPYGCRYRLIDFPLSSMVNAGISKVGVITKANYRSLMDHLGMGKAWDLSRKREGLIFLPPFVGAGTGGNQTRIEGLRSAAEFLANSKEEFVVMSDCNIVCNFDYRALLQKHAESGAQITIACRRGPAPLYNTLRLQLDESTRVTEARLTAAADSNALYSLNIFVLRKSLLESLLREANAQGAGDYEFIQRNVNSLRIFGAETTEHARVIDSLQNYYDASLELLQPDVRRALFVPARPVFAKSQDDMPTIYGLRSVVNNCLVAEGCQIKGEARGSVIFRDVVIEKGASVKNCVLMQGSYISAGVTLESVIADKSVTIKPGKTLVGARNFPLYLGKKIVV